MSKGSCLGAEDAVDALREIDRRVNVDHAENGDDADREGQCVSQRQAGGGGPPELTWEGPPRTLRP
jgi:hypothetical protein